MSPHFLRDETLCILSMEVDTVYLYIHNGVTNGMPCTVTYVSDTTPLLPCMWAIFMDSSLFKYIFELDTYIVFQQKLIYF